mgnify:CR=1 FL=1
MKIILLLVVLTFNGDGASFQWIFDSQAECETAKASLVKTPYFQDKETRPKDYAAACAPLKLVEIKL